MAGAATAHVEGAQGLFFNPAGLANGDRLGLELSLNFSPTFGRFSGPITVPNVRVDGDRTFSPVFGGLVGYRPTERLGLGVGVFVAGGTNADYPNVSLIGFGPGFAAFNPEFKAYLSVIDLSFGGAYELFEGFRLGAAWRISFVNATLDTVAPVLGPGGAPVAAVAAQLKSLNDTRLNGFRLGFQYAPKQKMWGFGANIRTGISFDAEGDLNSQLFVAGGTTATPLPKSTASASNVFPWQYQFGVFVAPLQRKLIVSAQYDYANYAANRNIVLNGTIPVPAVAGGPRALPSIPQHWSGQHVVRIGGEYTGFQKWAFRAGYAFTSRVTSAEFARPTFAAPGAGHTFALGTGYRFMDGRLRTDLGGDYSFDEGDGTNEFGVPGSFRADAWTIHGGVTFFL